MFGFVDFEEIDVFGSTKRKRELAERVVTFAKHKLFPKTQYVILDVELIPNLVDKQGVAGCCGNAGDRQFEILVDSKQSYDDFVSTILHEMVHVKQYIKGELKEAAQFASIWKKKKYERDHEYHDRPWEIEAYALEKVLLEQWKEKERK